MTRLDACRFDAKKIKPRYEFGYGLSYTSFDYSHLMIRSTDKHDRHSLAKAGLYDNVYTVSFEVKNAGRRDGHEVSQLYLVGLVIVCSSSIAQADTSALSGLP